MYFSLVDGAIRKIDDNSNSLLNGKYSVKDNENIIEEMDEEGLELIDSDSDTEKNDDAIHHKPRQSLKFDST